MIKKISSLMLTLILLVTFATPALASQVKSDKMELATEMPIEKGEVDPSADNNTAKNKGKVIVIDMNRVNMDNMSRFKSISGLIDKSAFIGQMNIRGDKGYDDRRNYASIGSTGRVNILPETRISFEKSTEDQKKIYQAATGTKALNINLDNINFIDFYNQNKGEYKSSIGYLGQTLSSNGKKIGVLGNSDYYDSTGQFVKNRDFCLAVMDSRGRIHDGVLDGINKKKTNFPYGIGTDYKKLREETKRLYESSDLLFVELGDTFRLDEYKENLNKNTYAKMKRMVYSEANKYIASTLKMAGDNDTIYIIGSFPSRLDYKNNRRLAPVIRIDKSEKGSGLLETSTTRRKGVIANIDLGVDILNRFGLKNKFMNGRVIKSVPMENSFEYLQKDYKKIIAISSIRMSIINIYVTIIVASWIICALALWKKEKIPQKHRGKVLNVLKEFVKLGLIMPLAFLTAPILQARTEPGVALSIIAATIVYYLAGRVLFKNDDMKQICLFASAMIAIIVVDSALYTPLMESNIMSYDPMIGARYYGIGNEYEGVTIGSAIIAFAILLEHKSIKRWMVVPFLLLVLFTSAYPAMGANVGGAISECVAYIVFILLIYDIKIDFKKALMILLATGGLVVAFAIADIALGLGSHLGNFVNQILANGPMEIVNVFARKIEMNVKLAQTTVWVNILLAGLAILALIIFRPNKNFAAMKAKYPLIYKGYLSIMVGCIVTLFVNDSGIISSATDSIYLLIPIIIIMINEKMSIENINKEKIC
ncbi:hypothetical protein PN296_01305 [Peptostreptococcus anaerobius]|uniref:hypothetical protein n=1 Tax=Peptostreptococcus TaxID=1257 RepID=UPI0007671489|nr:MULTISPECIES: hypothetical protein [Peptostreptococcus]KXB73443.1 hypothetical protein HMPREF3183_00211 [Peptostreptococcus anaerobius]MDB8820554.1 hypothetical protein [Peptostreptococcus anaerobius]MDB8825445.1 hypothetical protein [Peptostreptococcus anaerobius]MDB8827279.1 hypothetical protein [Peptostreptococcus anaerobius]MDB8828869.1 hypothetical protein [Peptostreptococcus anaerobius]